MEWTASQHDPETKVRVKVRRHATTCDLHAQNKDKIDLP